MRPPRRWAVWLAVLVMGASGASEPCHALVGQDGKLVLPIEAPEEQSGDPDIPTGPGQLRCIAVWESVVAPSLIVALGAPLATLLARVTFVAVPPAPRQEQDGRR